MRLNKFIASTGYCSRRKADELIESGTVRINGEPATLGHQVDPQNDRISIHGKTIHAPDKFTYIMLNKPTGYTTTKSDPHADRTIYELLPDKFHHLHSAGRLDRESEGLLLLTDDGDFTHSITHPRNNCEKIYKIKVKGTPTSKTIARLQSGITIKEDNGDYHTRPCEIIPQKNGMLQVKLHEGRKRQIRKMFATVGHPVTYLKRVKMGGYELGNLKKGDWKKISVQ